MMSISFATLSPTVSIKKGSVGVVTQISKVLLCHSFDPNYPVFGPRLVVRPLCQSVTAAAPVKACFPKKTNGKERQIEGIHKRMLRNKLANFASRKTMY